jgi:DUF4097 and DUF4098 domain-containing protein YvlB
MAEHRFHTPGHLHLEVSVPIGAIEIETLDGEESVVIVEGDDKLVDRTEVELRGDRLAVTFRGRGSLLGITIGIGDFSIGGGRLSVRATVPHGSDVKASSASADVKIRGRVGSIDLKTVSGDVELAGECERDAVVKTVSGDAWVDRVGGHFRGQTVSGDLTVGAINRSIVAKSVSGDLRFDSVREGDAEFTTVSGDVHVGIASGSYLDVDAGSVSGDLSSEVPLASEPGGVNGDGPTVVLRGKTVSGDVKVVRA